MRASTTILLTAVLLQVLALAQPPGPGGPGPVPSAAQPAAAGEGDQGFARRGLEALRSHLAARDALAPGKAASISLPDEGLSARCLAAEAPPGVGPVLLCQFGPSGAESVALGIYWQEDGFWLAQLYPQAPETIAGERRAFFAPQGCTVGCHGAVRRARVARGPDGLEFLVVADLGTPVAPMEEVHLLEEAGDEWRVSWVPSPGDWNWGHAQVTLLQHGLDAFDVRSSSWGRHDRFAGYLAEPADGEHRWFQERWVRRATSYILRDQVEVPGAYGSLVRLIYYLSHRYDQRAESMLGPDISLEEARKALAQQPPRQGWKVERVDGATFRLDRNQDGRPDLETHFRQEGAEWILTALKSLSGGSAPSAAPHGGAQNKPEG